MKYLEQTKQTQKNLQENTPSQTFKDSSVVLFEYGNILLKKYIEIANTGNLELLVVSGKASQEELSERWELIIAENGKVSNDNQYNIYQSLMYDYGLLIAQQTVVATCLEILTWKVDFEVIEEVRSRGYKIDTTQLGYAKSLSSAKSKCRNLITKAESKRKDINRQFGKDDEESKKNARQYSYDEIIGFLELALDRTIMDAETLTLAKYNVLKKGAQDRHKQKNGRTNTSGRTRI